MITVTELLERTEFAQLNKIPMPDREITCVYCCDLLSVAMGKAPADSAWVTVMGNVNAVAVSALADTACVIVADGAGVDERALAKADEQGVILIGSAMPVFETAKIVDGLL